MPLSLEQAPPGVAADVWLRPMYAPPAIGDLWLLSWDGEVLGLAIVSGVASSFVLAWPVTLVGDPVFPPAVGLDTSPLGSIAVWPSRETGVGKHLMHRRFGTALSAQTMALLLSAFEDGAEPVLPFAVTNVDQADRETVSDEMVDRWEAINAHLWPEPVAGETPLNPDALRALGVQVGDLREALGVTVPEAVSLFGGEAAPTPEQLDTLAERFDLAAEQLLLNRMDEAILHMLSPDIKDDVLEIGRRRGLDEARARSLVRSQFALAARSDGNPRARLDAAIHRLLNVNEA